ncbi:MAG: peptidoglycan DD-metalloendopeptidase family protein [Rickettsiales bacterium]|jgi:murein DD-endopeptidase MepM/ murein hydrolase activator NlpD|nr:peptidoglycan DD-metalloendopeptidase family protein [Rickettsiales bacterium]
MKCPNVLFLAFLLSPVLCANAADKGFLTAQSFPGTFSDLSFVERMKVLKEGYEPFETKYDEDGFCISGCAFQGMRLEDAEDYYRRQAEIAAVKAEAVRALHPEWSDSQQPQAPIHSNASQTVPLPPAYQPAVYQPAADASSARAACPVRSPSKESIPAAQTIPTWYPLNGAVHVNSSYGKRNAPATKNGRRGTSCHHGVDLRAATGDPVFATVAGTVVSAEYSGDCGNFVKVKSLDGFSVGYCHLSRIMVKKGDVVAAGCVVGQAGNSGNSGGAHLHYIVYDENNAQICPEKFMPSHQNISGKPACSTPC